MKIQSSKRELILLCFWSHYLVVSFGFIILVFLRVLDLFKLMASCFENVALLRCEEGSKRFDLFADNLDLEIDILPPEFILYMTNESGETLNVKFSSNRTNSYRFGTHQVLIESEMRKIDNFDLHSFLWEFDDDDDALTFFKRIDYCKNGMVTRTGTRERKESSNIFDSRTEKWSATQYFQFYSHWSRQQSTMQDYIRTSTHQRAVLSNCVDFRNKVVLDVGAGFGILNFFAVQAGAKKVYVVEASNMAKFCEQLVQNNESAGKIIVVSGKIEEVNTPKPVDVLISESMGYMLFNERMLETYVHAKGFLRRDIQIVMYQTVANLYAAPFSDEALCMEQAIKANFWFQQSSHGVDLPSVRKAANRDNFSQPVVYTFDVGICMSQPLTSRFDFRNVAEQDSAHAQNPKPTIGVRKIDVRRPGSAKRITGQVQRAHLYPGTQENRSVLFFFFFLPCTSINFYKIDINMQVPATYPLQHSPGITSLSTIFLIFHNNQHMFTVNTAYAHILYTSLSTLLDTSDFYLMHQGHILHSSDPLSSLISSGHSAVYLTLHFRLRGGTDPPSPKKKGIKPVSATNVTNTPASPSLPCVDFFLDRDNSSRTWLKFHSQWLKANNFVDSFLRANSLLILLPKDIKRQIPNLADLFTSATPYDTLYAAVLNITDPSIDNIIQKYFNEHAIGTQKPSEFLHTAISQLSALGVTPANNADLLRRYFLSSLPTSIRALLTVVDDSTEVEKLATLADKSFDILQSNNALPVAATTTPTLTSPQADTVALTQQLQSMQLQFDTLQQSISAITAQLSSLTTHRRDASSAPRNRSSSRSSAFRSKSPGGGRLTCYYHTNFQRSAKKCHLGCRFYNHSFAVDSPICIYHAKYQSQARSCIPGCTFNKSNPSFPSSFPSFSKNE